MNRAERLGLRRGAAPDSYETDSYLVRGQRLTASGRQGARVNRWLVTERRTGRQVGSVPTLDRVRTLPGVAAELDAELARKRGT